MTLKALPTKPGAYCSAWHCRQWPDEIHGARCCLCGREIAITKEMKRLNCACIYCGLENGDVPAIEIGPDDDHPPFLVTPKGLKGRKLRTLSIL